MYVLSKDEVICFYPPRGLPPCRGEGACVSQGSQNMLV